MGSVAIQEDLSFDEAIRERDARVRREVQAFDILPRNRRELYRLTDEETFRHFDQEEKLADRYGAKVVFVMRRLRIHRNTPPYGPLSKEGITYAVLRYCGACEEYARKTMENPKLRKILGLD